MRVNSVAESAVRCGDRSCSIDGSCPLNSTQREVVLTSPPRLQLLSSPAADDNGIVQVPRGWLYAVCEPGTAGTLSESCAPGVSLYSLACLARRSFSLPLLLVRLQLHVLMFTLSYMRIRWTELFPQENLCLSVQM
jgi:hypothetical protein